MEIKNEEKSKKKSFKWLLIIGGIFFLIIIIVVFGRNIFVTPGTGPGGIVLPSGFTEHKVPFLGFMPEMEGITMTTYIGPGTTENALDVFKASAIDAGWTPLLGEEIPTIGIPGVGIEGTVISSAGLEKDDKILAINIMQVGNQITVMVLEMPKWQEETLIKEAPPEKIGPPTLDVEGSDIPNLPRYPGSVRTSYWSMDFGGGDEMLTISYITSANIDEVLKFYQEEILANNWTDIVEMQMEGVFFLMGYKNGVNAKISINPDEYYPGYVSITFVIGG